MMKRPKWGRFMRLAIVIAVMTALAMIVYAEALPDAPNGKPGVVMIAQNTTQAPAAEKPAASTTDQKAESGTAEKKETEKKGNTPLEDFRPSERIEAEQAVDFPYDI